MTAADAITVRTATLADADHLADWNYAMADLTEARKLDRATLAAGVRGVFADIARGFYLVAELAGQSVGGLLVTYEWSDWRNGPFWWIQSVYVIPEARRQGVFRTLYAEVTMRARMAGAVGVRLYVELENQRAHQTYTALGMQRCRYHMYETTFGGNGPHPGPPP